MVTGSINEPIFAGHQYRYAKQSANLLVQASKLDEQKDIDDVISTIIDSYINYYRVLQNMKIIQQNLADINNKLVEIQKFENQGLATKNDVLRFQLQRSNIELDSIELDNNRKVVNYNLDILLGLPDSTTIQLQDITYKLDANNGLDGYIQLALRDRKEFGQLMYQDKISDVNIKKIHDEVLPTVSASGSLYYINPTQAIIPKSGNFISPFLLGINLNWDIASLYKNKNKLNEASLQKQAVTENRDVLGDKVKMQVHEAYSRFQLQLDRIKLLQDAVTQASENERITESKYQNNLATTTDRIDAQTLLYQARLNLELAKTDATEAYYKLQWTIGHIQP
jgi:outer membrane protein